VPLEAFPVELMAEYSKTGIGGLYIGTIARASARLVFKMKPLGRTVPLYYSVIQQRRFYLTLGEPPSMKSLLTIRVPTELKLALEEIREEEGVDISELVRDSLKRIIALHQLKKARTKTRSFAEQVGIFSDEDVFEKLRS